MTNEPDPLVRAAITTLDLFGALSAREARVLLGMWARRGELTADQAEQVIAHYPARHQAYEGGGV